MTKKKQYIPKIGDIIYIPSELYLFRGIDDIYGGKAKIIEVDDTRKYIYIRVEAFPGIQYNWEVLKEKQEKLKKKFGDHWACRDPDFRLEFNDDRIEQVLKIN